MRLVRYRLFFTVYRLLNVILVSCGFCTILYLSYNYFSNRSVDSLLRHHSDSAKAAILQNNIEGHFNCRELRAKTQILSGYSDILSSTKPKHYQSCPEPPKISDIRLNQQMPNGFILPVYRGEPTEQLFSLYSSIQLARKLHRSLVVTPFFFSQLDQLSTLMPRSMSLEVRVSIENLVQMVPVATLEYYNQVCNSQINEIYISFDNNLQLPDNTENLERLREFEYATKLDNMFTNDGTLAGRQYFVNAGEYLADFSTEDNAETCLLVVFPHHNHTSADGLPLNVLRTPKYIEELATEYMEDYMKYSSGAMAIEDDMLNPSSFCKDIITEHHAQSLGERFLERWRYCQMNVTQEELAGDMVRTITQLIRGKQGEELFHLVVTGNLGLRLSNMIKDGLMGFAQRVPVRIFDQNDIETFLKKNYYGCCFVDSYFGEIVTMIEDYVLQKTDLVHYPGDTLAWHRLKKLRNRQKESVNFLAKIIQNRIEFPDAGQQHSQIIKSHSNHTSL